MLSCVSCTRYFADMTLRHHPLNAGLCCRSYRRPSFGPPAPTDVSQLHATAATRRRLSARGLHDVGPCRVIVVAAPLAPAHVAIVFVVCGARVGRVDAVVVLAGRRGRRRKSLFQVADDRDLR